MIRGIALAAFHVVVLAAGCASFDGRGLVPGKSTQAEVEALMGAPAQRLALQEREWWEYKYFDYEQRRVIWVQFSRDGVVREVLDMLDWDHDKPGARARRSRAN